LRNGTLQACTKVLIAFLGNDHAFPLSSHLLLEAI